MRNPLSQRRQSLLLAVLAIIVTIAILTVIAVTKNHRDSNPIPISASRTVSPQVARFISPVSTDGTVQQKMTQYLDSTQEIRHGKTERFLEAVHIGQIKTASGLPLNGTDATVTRTDDGQYVVHVPFTAQENVLEISGYTAFLDQELRVIQTGEVLFTALTEDSGRMQLWQNGQLTLDKAATNDSSTITDASGSTTQPVTFSWSKLNKCLLNAGVSQWALTLIGTGCALLCGATLGTGCVACIVGFAGIAGGTVGTCIGKAMA